VNRAAESDARPAPRLPHTRRRHARECAIEALYRVDLLGDEPEAIIAEVARRRKLVGKGRKYLERLMSRVRAEPGSIDAALTESLDKWALKRVGYLDRAILRIAACELLFFPDVPTSAVINEAIDLARRYGDEKSGKFVNGVLDAVARRRRPAAGSANDVS
jgi:transcription antitermination protein NusB